MANWGLDARQTRVNESGLTIICESFAIGIMRISLSIPVVDPLGQFVSSRTDIAQWRSAAQQAKRLDDYPAGLAYSTLEPGDIGPPGPFEVHAFEPCDGDGFKT